MSVHEATVARSEIAFERAKTPMLVAAGMVIVGLAIAGSVERTTGGVIVIAAWMVGVFAIHRLGRAGSTRLDRSAPVMASPPPPPPDEPSDEDAS